MSNKHQYKIGDLYYASNSPIYLVLFDYSKNDNMNRIKVFIENTIRLWFVESDVLCQAHLR